MKQFNAKPNIVNKFTLSLLIAFTCTLPVSFLLPKYNAELISKTLAIPDYYYAHEDLNEDGNSERIEYMTPHENMLSIIVRKNSQVINQWNIRGAEARTNKPFVADYNNDGTKEIIVFTLHNDSIFLHAINFQSDPCMLENKAICKVYKAKGIFDFTIYPCGTFDSDGDGTKEIYFSICTGFSKRPRNMYAYNPVNNKVLMSPQGGTLVIYPEMVDLDADNIPEFLGTVNHATGNFGPDHSYSDQYSWLMVFDADMNFKFPPICFPAHPATTRITPYHTEKTKHLLVLHYHEGTKKYPNFLALFDPNGKLIRKRLLSAEEYSSYDILLSAKENNTNYLIKQDGKVMQIDSLLNLKYVKQINKRKQNYLISQKDLDCDGETEILIEGKEKGELVIYRNDFSAPVHLYLNEYITSGQLSIIQNSNDLPKIFISTKDYTYTFKYEASILHRYRFLLIIPIYLIILSCWIIIEKIKDYKRLKVENTQQKIAELQIKSAQNQLDPHFTLNLFSSFSNLINEKDPQKAELLFSRYAHLLRVTVLNSNETRIRLSEEIAFVKSYLALESFRYSNKFSFDIDIDKNIDQDILIPKMLMHIFVENAVKHGLKHLDSNGALTINGIHRNGTIHISIKDNGIGRTKAKEIQSFSTGKGLQLLDALIKYHKKTYKQHIEYKTTDLYNNNLAAGTLIDLWIKS